MKNLREYANFYGKDADNNFAVACYNDNSIEELGTLAICIKNDNCSPDETSLKEWGISENEWKDAIIAALREKESDLLD